MSAALEAAFADAQPLADGLRRATDALPQSLGAQSVVAPTPDFIDRVDLFIARFNRLQDTLGARVLRAVLVDRFGEPYEDRPLRDVLDRLEALGIIDSAGRWLEIRTMRDHLAHEYPEDHEVRADSIRSAREMAGEMLTLLGRIGALTAGRP